MMNKIEECIKVVVRLKPNVTNSKTVNINSDCPPVLRVVDIHNNKEQLFQYDDIFDQDADQIQLYERSVQPMVERVRKGHNCTVFAYGQTGTGKSYTMGTCAYDQTSPDESGLIERTLLDFMDNCDGEDISISFIEVYNEKVYNLLSKVREPLGRTNFMQVIKISSATEALSYLRQGLARRMTDETRQNLTSSRSHAIFTIHNRGAKLNLVDLAGSESVKKNGSHRDAMWKEGVSINMSLLNIGKVIRALAANSSYIPYRDSFITTLLHDSLTTSSTIVLIACISTKDTDLTETLETLQFAQKVKQIHFRVEPTPLKRNPLKPLRKFQAPYSFAAPHSVRCVADQALHHISDTPVASSTMSLQTDDNERLSDIRAVNGRISRTPQAITPIVNRVLGHLEATITTCINSAMKKVRRPPSISRLPPRTPLTWALVRDNLTKVLSELVNNEQCYHEVEDEDPPLARQLFTNDECNQNEHLFKKPKRSHYTENMDTTLTERRSNRHINRSINTSYNESERKFQSSSSDRTILTILPRRSVRLQNKENVPMVHVTNKNLKRNKQSKGKHVSHTVKTAERLHLQNVLNVLNRGSERELQMLATIGPKSAKLIITCRSVKGGFKTIEDLSDRLKWSSKKLEEFCMKNFI